MEQQKLVPHVTQLTPALLASFLPSLKMSYLDLTWLIDGVEIELIGDGYEPVSGVRVMVYANERMTPNWWQNAIMISLSEFDALGGKLPCRDCDGTGVFYQIEGTPCPCTRPEIMVTL